MDEVIAILNLNENEQQALSIMVGMLILNPSATDDCQNNLLGSLRQLFDLLCEDLSTR